MELQIITAKLKTYKFIKSRSATILRGILLPELLAVLLQYCQNHEHGSGSIAAILLEVPVVLPERVISGNIARN